MDRAALFSRFTSCSWSELLATPRAARRRKFTLPGVDEIPMLEAARRCIEAVVTGRQKPWRIEPNFLEEGGFFARDFLDTFSTAWKFYDALLHSTQRFASQADSDVTGAYPAEELVAVSQKAEPCDWKVRWAECGGIFYEGRMVAKRDDAVWASISVLGLPFPPFEFGSAMDWRPVSDREWKQLVSSVNTRR